MPIPVSQSFRTPIQHHACKKKIGGGGFLSVWFYISLFLFPFSFVLFICLFSCTSCNYILTLGVKSETTNTINNDESVVHHHFLLLINYTYKMNYVSNLGIVVFNYHGLRHLVFQSQEIKHPFTLSIRAWMHTICIGINVLKMAAVNQTKLFSSLVRNTVRVTFCKRCFSGNNAAI